jgi:hypothetical protein
VKPREIETGDSLFAKVGGALRKVPQWVSVQGESDTALAERMYAVNKNSSHKLFKILNRSPWQKPIATRLPSPDAKVGHVRGG